jgi:hypothetical protein
VRGGLCGWVQMARRMPRIMPLQATAPGIIAQKRATSLRACCFCVGCAFDLLSLSFAPQHTDIGTTTRLTTTTTRPLPCLGPPACHPFLSPLYHNRTEAGGRPRHQIVCVIPTFPVPSPRTTTQASKMVPSRRSLLRVALLAAGLSLALGFLVGQPATRISSSPTAATSPRRDATIVHAGPTLLPTKPMPATQPAGLGSKLFLPAFLPPWIARDTVRTQVSEDIFFLEQVCPPPSCPSCHPSSSRSFYFGLS